MFRFQANMTILPTRRPIQPNTATTDSRLDHISKAVPADLDELAPEEEEEDDDDPEVLLGIGPVGLGVKVPPLGTAAKQFWAAVFASCAVFGSTL